MHRLGTRVSCLILALLTPLLFLGGCRKTAETDAAAQPSASPAPHATSAPQEDEEPVDEETAKQLDDELAESLTVFDGVINILLVGVDNRGDELDGLADSIILFTLDAKKGEVRMTSFMRDLYVPILNHATGRTRHDRINVAVALGGVEQLVDVIQDDFGVKVDNYAMVNVDILVDMVDSLGGLELDIDQSLIRPMNNVLIKTARQWPELKDECVLIQEPGAQLCTGAQVQAYARMRKGAGDDQARTARQREVIVRILKKAAQQPLHKYPALIRTLTENVKTDLNEADILTYAFTVLTKKIDLEQAGQLQVPMEGWYRDGNSGKVKDVLIANIENLREAVIAWVGEGVQPGDANGSDLYKTYRAFLDRTATPEPTVAPQPSETPAPSAPADEPEEP